MVKFWLAVVVGVIEKHFSGGNHTPNRSDDFLDPNNDAAKNKGHVHKS